MFINLKNKSNDTSRQQNTIVTSHQIKSIRFKKTFFSFLDLKPNYFIEYKTVDNKKFIINTPKKALLEALLINSMYIPNYKISYLYNAFNNINNYLKKGKIKLFVLHWTVNGKIKYIQVNRRYKDLIDITESDKENWIPLTINEKENLSFLQLIRK